MLVYWLKTTSCNLYCNNWYPLWPEYEYRKTESSLPLFVEEKNDLKNQIIFKPIFFFFAHSVSISECQYHRYVLLSLVENFIYNVLYPAVQISSKQHISRFVNAKSNCRWKNLMRLFNCLPNDKVLDSAKMKAFKNDNLNVAQDMKFVLGLKTRSERRKCWLLAFVFFFPFPTVFKNPYT